MCDMCVEGCWQALDFKHMPLLGCLQVIQLFDSWAHRLTPAHFCEFSLPYMERIIKHVHAVRPGIPVILHCNGGGNPSDLLLLTLAEDFVRTVDLCHVSAQG